MTINVLSQALFFCRTKKAKHSKGKHMKKLFRLTTIVSAMAALALLAACQTTGTGQTAQKESLLSQSGFKVITVTTPKQEQAVRRLAQGSRSAVHYNGKVHYVFPPRKQHQINVPK